MPTNLLTNGNFSHGLAGWKKVGPEGAFEAGVNLSKQWSLEGTPTAYLHAKSPDVSAKISQDFPLGAPAAQVQRITFTGHFGTQRTEGEVMLSTYAKDGRTLGIFTHYLPPRAAKQGGNKPEGYVRVNLESPTPPGTANVRLQIRTGKHSGAAEAAHYLFFHSLSVAWVDHGSGSVGHRLPAQMPRIPGSPAARLAGPATAATVDVVVPVHNAPDDVKTCLQSLAWYSDGLLGTTFVVNDGSDAQTSEWLRQFCATHAGFQLIEHERSLGFSRSVNDGLHLSQAHYAVILNSDTIVTTGWLTSMIACMESDRSMGIVGPLSNAASWQNVPELLGPDKKFAINQLPKGMTPHQMAILVRKSSSRSYPRVKFLNGFCFMVRREVFHKIGYLDAKSFPRGYGEENDFCIRAAEAGFQLAVVDDAYVFHAKSKSFGHETRRELSDQGMATLKRKHVEENVATLIKKTRENSALVECRERTRTAVERYRAAAASADLKSVRPLFILSCRGGGGGAHSVVQEVAAMRDMGVDAAIAVLTKDLPEFHDLYADIPCVREIFRPFDRSPAEASTLQGCNVAIGTIFTSMKFVKQIVQADRSILPAYYIQDYEPWFVTARAGMHQEALRSFTLIPDTACFAKTHWLCRLVQEKHGVEVAKVSPSLDHSVYKPGKKPDDGRVHICAMVRPNTSRRSPLATMELFEGLHRELGNRVALHIFGCAPDGPDFLCLPRDFPYVHHGILKRPQVACLLGACHMFVDMSKYQAFGRTGLEAMACGCIPAVPRWGGTAEYISSEQGPGLLLDTLDQASALQVVAEFIRKPPELAAAGTACIEIASRFSTETAARNIRDILVAHLSLFVSSPTSCLK